MQSGPPHDDFEEVTIHGHDDGGAGEHPVDLAHEELKAVKDERPPSRNAHGLSAASVLHSQSGPGQPYYYRPHPAMPPIEHGPTTPRKCNWIIAVTEGFPVLLAVSIIMFGWVGFTFFVGGVCYKGTPAAGALIVGGGSM